MAVHGSLKTKNILKARLSPNQRLRQARVGEEIELTVQCENVYNGANVYFAVWNEGANRETDAPVKKIVGQNEGGEARVRWKYFVPRDVDLSEINAKFIFTVDAFRCEQVEADTIEFTDDVWIHVLLKSGEEYFAVKNKITLKGNSGSEHTFNADDSTGIIKGESVSVGSLKMTIDAREGIDQGDTRVELEDIEDREQRKVIQVDRFDFENDHIDIQSGRAYIIIFSMEEDLLSG